MKIKLSDIKSYEVNIIPNSLYQNDFYTKIYWLKQKQDEFDFIAELSIILIKIMKELKQINFKCDSEAFIIALNDRLLDGETPFLKIVYSSDHKFKFYFLEIEEE